MPAWRWSDPKADRALRYALAEWASLAGGVGLFLALRSSPWNEWPASLVLVLILYFVVTATMSAVFTFGLLAVVMAVDSLAAPPPRAVAAALSLAMQAPVFVACVAIYVS